MPLSKKQIALVHVAKKQLNLSDEYYRGMLWAIAGVESSKDLDADSFQELMDAFYELGFNSDSKDGAAIRADRPGMATYAQVLLIANLWDDYTDGEGQIDRFQLDRWIEKFFGVSSLRFVTAEQAAKVIAALRKMTARRARERKSG